MATRHFKIHSEDTKTRARTATLETRHGFIQTPIFMPVGTQATVKSVLPCQLEGIGAQIILGNTYHLNLRPTSELIADFGSLHTFMGWDKPILTDSGGFQVFSLASLRKITQEGVQFASHLDGKKIFLDPKRCFEIQRNLGTDIAMVLDVCPPWPCEEKACQEAVGHTLRWAEVFKKIATNEGFLQQGHHVFGIAQGSVYPHLRRDCAQNLAEMDFPGYAIGGVSVGEPEPEMLEQVEMCIPYLPKEKPRYIMGVGTPPQLLKMVAQGADMFDCVMPTRLARHGTVFTPDGPINIRNEQYKKDDRPIMEGLHNVCSTFSRAYLRHLIVTGEMLACTLLSIHNLHFYLDLMAQVRQHIEAGDYQAWGQAWCTRYEAGEAKRKAKQ